MTAEEKTTKRPARLRFEGRVLYLTEDTSLIRRQLEGGENLEYDPARPLMNNISTDEITPGWVCFYYDETLGEYVYVGMREGAVKKDEVRRGGFSVVVSGLSKGCGSSRETAPFAEITRGLDPVSQSIVEYGGLFNYNKARLAGAVTPPAVETRARPMNIVEKIIARHAFVRAGEIGVEAVRPGDALFAVADVRFSHEYVTPMAESLFKQALGRDARVTEPGSVYAFRDHLTFLGRVMPEEKRKMGLLERANGLAVTQESFTDEQGIRLYGGTEERGSEAICHNAVVEDIALPGQLVIGTDSHTCMAGVLGCFAFGVGSTDMANAWYTKDIRIKVPETVKFVLKGEKRADVSAKDVMLVILATDYMKEGKGIGQVLEFAGEGLRDWSIDERATLTNMAVEAGGLPRLLRPAAAGVGDFEQGRGRGA